MRALQLGGELAQPQVAQLEVAQRLQRMGQRPLALEEGVRGIDRHGEHVGDRLAVELYLQRLVIVARAMAGRAGRVDAGQEQQLDEDEALALAFRAAPLGDVEREAPGIVAPCLGLRRGREQPAHMVEQAGIGRQVGARRAPDRFLVDHDQAGDLVKAVPPFSPTISPATVATGASASVSWSLSPPASGGSAWPSRSATASTRNWRTRRDFPEPETPVNTKACRAAARGRRS